MKRNYIVACALLLLSVCGAGCQQPSPAKDVQSPATDGVTANRGDAEVNAARPKRGRPESGSQPGQFDFYLLALSWSPEFCLTHGTNIQCASGPGFVLHGLWPENADGTYPEDCSNAPGPADPSAYKDIYPDAGLLTHEWTTHGTCTGLQPDVYFQLLRQAKASVRIPGNLANKSTPAQETPAELIDAFAQVNKLPAADFALSCGNNRLTAMEVCMDKTLHPMSCASVRSCRANVVKITAPGAQ